MAILVTIISLVLFIATFAAAFPFMPPGTLASAIDRPGIVGLIELGLIIAYVILHELTHAAVMKYYGTKTICFGFTGMYAYTGSKKYYFNRYAYMRIAIAPVLFWGVIFTALALILPRNLFWNVWLLQTVNVSGAAGDLYIFLLLCKKGNTYLWFKDTGVRMDCYSNSEMQDAAAC